MVVLDHSTVRNAGTILAVFARGSMAYQVLRVVSLKARRLDKVYFEFVQARRRNEMKCQRCESEKEAEFRVASDVMDIKVCVDCAGEAREIGLSLEIVEIGKPRASREQSRGARYLLVMVSDGAH